MPVSDPHDLYGLPLDRFVPERTALARALRSEGHRQRAAQVSKLRKPSVAAWAVNQLVRTQRRAVAKLFDAGDELQRAQSDLLGGRVDAQNLRAAADRERLAVEQLTETAGGLLTSHGHELSAMTLERVRETLRAAALDGDARGRVKDGRLKRELRHVGLGEITPGAPAQQRTPSGRRSAARPAPRVERNRAEPSRATRKAAADVRRAADRAARELRIAQLRRDRAAAALEEAEAALADARQRAEHAALSHRRAVNED